MEQLSYMVNYRDREKYDVSSLDRVFSGGAPLPNEVRLKFEKLFGCSVVDGYGQSEASPAITGYYEEDTFRPGSVGRTIPGVEASVQDRKNQIQQAGAKGEICACGPNIMKGYWKDEAATAKAIVDGWLHTGDIGYMDEDGFIYITDRDKDVIIKGAENISPREIEEAIYEHPSVAEAAVIGVPDFTFGEEICAAIVLKQDTQATEADIRQHIGKYVNKYKIPTHVIFRDELPKSPVGKILKREVREEIIPLLGKE